MKKAIPEFKIEAEAFEFWSSHGEGADSTKFLDWSQAKRTKFPNLKPTLRTISVRLPVAMIEDLKILANKRDVPYQSLLKMFLGGAARGRTKTKEGKLSRKVRQLPGFELQFWLNKDGLQPRYSELEAVLVERCLSTASWRLLRR